MHGGPSEASGAAGEAGEAPSALRGRPGAGACLGLGGAQGSRSVREGPSGRLPAAANAPPAAQPDEGDIRKV